MRSGTAGIRDGLDGAKVIFASRRGQESAESLEIRIVFSAALGAALFEVGRHAIDLPDLNNCVADRFAVGPKDAAAQVSNFPNGRGCRVVDNDQVVVRVERKLVRIKRALGHPWRRPHERFGERSRNGEEPGPPTGMLEKPPTGERDCIVHKIIDSKICLVHMAIQPGGTSPAEPLRSGATRSLCPGGGGSLGVVHAPEPHDSPLANGKHVHPLGLEQPSAEFCLCSLPAKHRHVLACG